MAAWRVAFTKAAERDLAALDRPVRRMVIEALEWFSEHFDELVPLPLGGPFKGFFKFRIGDLRAIYEMRANERLLVVHHIDKRDQIYKR